MSIIIIVLLVIVLIVAIVLKKKQDNQANAAPKKNAAQKTVKKPTARPARKTAATTEAPAPAPEPQKTTPIPDNLRQKLEQLIQGNHFQSAEAQINQALKQDSSQHELYIYLLDLHIAQKDEIAIDQLIRHIHALKLDDIVQSAEAKHREYEKNKQPDAIEFNSSSQQRTHQSNVAAQDNTSEFDALVQPSSSQSFDDLQSELVAPTQDAKPTEEVKPTEAKVEFQPLDFNFSVDTKAAPEATPEKTETPVANEQKPLEFSFSLEPITTEQAESEPEAAPVAKPDAGLEFKLVDDVDTAPQKAEAIVAEDKADEKADEALPSLDFTFDAPQVESAEPAEIATEVVKNTTEQPAIVFEETTAPVEIVEVAAVEEVPEIAAVQKVPVVTATTSPNDPLTKSFPDLQQLDETELDLDLAAQYIELGAYDSARVLLQNDRTSLNAEQQQRAEMLLNKIAS